MTKKNLALFTLVVLLGGLSLYLNRNRFQSAQLELSARSLPPRGWMLRVKKTPAEPVIFMLNRKVQLTSVQVVSVNALQTNQFALPVWRLTSDSNSVPVDEFYYGFNIRGMKPVVRGIPAEPLEPGQKYRLLLKTGSLKAQLDFTPVARAN